MIKQGMIFLYDRAGGLVTGRGYDSPRQRKEVIEMWRKMYAAKFYTCFIQIAPHVDATRVLADGRNSKKHKPEPV